MGFGCQDALLQHYDLRRYMYILCFILSSVRSCRILCLEEEEEQEQEAVLSACLSTGTTIFVPLLIATTIYGILCLYLFVSVATPFSFLFPILSGTSLKPPQEITAPLFLSFSKWSERKAKQIKQARQYGHVMV